MRGFLLSCGFSVAILRWGKRFILTSLRIYVYFVTRNNGRQTSTAAAGSSASELSKHVRKLRENRKARLVPSIKDDFDGFE